MFHLVRQFEREIARFYGVLLMVSPLIRVPMRLSYVFVMVGSIM